MMELKLLRDSVQMEQPLGICQSQAVVEGEITLPGGLREEARVLHADAMAALESAESMLDRMHVSGRVVFHVLYTQGAPDKVQCIEAAADFTHLCDLPGATPRADAFAQATVEQVQASVNGGRLSMKAVVRIDARAVLDVPLEVLTGVEAEAGTELRTSEASLARTVARGVSDVLLREEFDLPSSLQIRETLYAVATPMLTEVSGGQGRIGFSGQVLLEAVHASDMPGKPVVVTRHTLPLEQSVDLTGENGDLLQGRIAVKDVAVASQEAGDGERTLRTEVLLNLQGWADRQETVTVLSDAYTTDGDDLQLTRREVTMRTGDLRVRTAESGKTTLLLPESAPPVRSVLAAFASPVVTQREQSGGKMNVQGTLSTRLIYMTDDTAAPVSVLQETPFRMSFSLQSAEEDFIRLTISEVDAVPVTSDRVELKYVIHLDAEGLRQEQATLVTDAQPVSALVPTRDVVLYFVQPGESLWDIARRYRIPVSAIRRLNPALSGQPKVGQGIVVWRRQCS